MSIGGIKMNSLQLKNIEEINKLRAKLEERFLNEKIYQNMVSEETVRKSQELDISIVEEQRRLFEEFKRNRAALSSAL